MKKAALLLALTLFAPKAYAQVDSTITFTLGTPQADGYMYVDDYGWQPRWLIPVNVSNPSARPFSAYGTIDADQFGHTRPNLHTTGNLRVVYGQGIYDPTIHGTFWPTWMGGSTQEMWPVANDSDHELAFAGWYYFNDPCGFNPTEGWVLSFPVWGTYGTVELLAANSWAHDCPNIIHIPLAVGPAVIVPPGDPGEGGGGGEGGCCREGAAVIEREGAPKEVKAAKRTTWGSIKALYR